VPFLVSAVATLLVLLVDISGSAGGWRALAGALVAVAVALPALVAWERLPRAADLAPPALFLAAGTVLLAGDHAPDVIWIPVFLVPLFWLALHHPHGHLLLGLVVSGSCVSGAFLAGAQVPGDSTGSLILLAAVVCALTLTVSRIVSQQRALSRRLNDAATHDPLTGVANRRALDEVLTTSIASAAAHDLPLCIALVDLDHFKRLNDALGHPAGDRFLVEAVRQWRAQLRRTDVLSRYGGEEFAVVLPECGLSEAVGVMERLRLSTPAGQTCSVGLAEWERGESADMVFARADAALYSAKRRGRNRVRVAASGHGGQSALTAV
jgi:diguanylate cyclase (GGDEF)-like protein